MMMWKIKLKAHDDRYRTGNDDGITTVILVMTSLAYRRLFGCFNIFNIMLEYIVHLFSIPFLRFLWNSHHWCRSHAHNHALRGNFPVDFPHTFTYIVYMNLNCVREQLFCYIFPCDFSVTPYNLVLHYQIFAFPLFPVFLSTTLFFFI